ncbi:rho GTPase-activating protein 27-like isoform X1 [Myxocyprinus asiaticus]|uniref:rho GTPase-activating protein 27-like isoform X1 n=1 Tax=Myxocyprinus asiaticus TaxID=70543 RepID=UPI002223C44A|nr:rho GTPase-activating protein 27-like isoform X1 [Myxocyprinus asiaticus]
MSLSQQVLVNFEYNYTTREGRTVSIKPNEHYILVAKTNDNWWHVRRNETDETFYIPAKYVTELPPEHNQTPLDPPEEFSGHESLRSSSGTAPFTLPDTHTSAKVTLRVPASIKTDTEKDGHRISTYIIPRYFFEPKVLEPNPIQTEAEASLAPEHESHDKSPNSASPTNGETPHTILLPHVHTVNTLSSEMETKSTMNEKETTERPQVDTKSLDEDIQMLIRAGWSPAIWNLTDNGKILYESIDTVREPESPKNEDNPAGTVQTTNSTTVPTPVTPDKSMVEDDSTLTAVYVNIPQLRKSVIDTSSPSTSPSQEFPTPPDTHLLDSGWEVHTDDQSGQEYYYHPSTGHSTWEYPLSYSMESLVRAEESRSPPSFPQSPGCSPVSPPPPSQRWSSDWEKVLDENSGRHYFFNSVSGQSSWDPPEDTGLSESRNFLEDCPLPLPEEDYPASPDQEEETSTLSVPLSAEYSLIHVKKASIPRASLDQNTPPGWSLSIDLDGTWVFTSDHTQEQWIKSLDDRGQTYYYLRDGTKSLWNLPEYSGSPGQYGVGNGASGEQDGMGSVHNWRHSTGYQEDKFHSSYHLNTSDNNIYSSPEIPNVSNLEKAGILNKTKVSENGKKVRKNWAHSWTVLHGGILTFHKDPKSTPTGSSSKSNQIVPEFTVDLKGATIGWATKDKSSKKNVLELKSRTGVEYLIQYDTESIINDWHKIIIDTIRQLDLDQHHSEDEEEISEKSSSTDREERSIDKRTMSNATRKPSTSSASEADQKKVRTKLKKFLLKRPTLQSVKDKGYIRENVFGCHLHNLCAQERTTVPNFVELCIRTVEKRGLEIDGLYRVSGNLAVIQKLRFKADHEDLDLEEGNWDIHVITGALKLFFRELQEPLFPYSLFNDFICGIKIPEYYNKLSHMKNLVRSLPAPNYDTMEALFSHLRKVIQHGDENRMTVQNVAIVFGPTLLKPEVETANLTMYMVFQNQIVEFLLSEFESIFHM